MEGNNPSKIENPAAEIQMLKERISQLEDSYREAAASKEKHEIVREALGEHLEQMKSAADEAYKLPPEEIKRHAIGIDEAQSENDKLQRLFDIAQTKGVVNAFDVARVMKDPHILDAFHDNFIKYHDMFLK